MLKKQQALEEFAITEPETPPQIQQPRRSKDEMIQRIISSNEELIQQQMLANRQLQRINYQQSLVIVDLQNKYQSLLEVITSQEHLLSNDKLQENKETYKIKDESKESKQRKIGAQTLLQKIIDLQHQLSTAKVQLAVKSAELLTYSLKSRIPEESLINRRKTLGSQMTKQQLSNYFQPQPLERSVINSEKKPQTAQQKQLFQQWNRMLQQYGGGEFKLSRFKQKTLGLIKKFIPKQLRGKLWDICVQNRLGMSNSLYIQLLERREKGWMQQKVRIQIDKDIKRSFYGKTNYETKTGIILEVAQFLQIFHIFRPDVSYVQGMTYPAIILIPILGKIKAFNLFCNLVLGNSFFRKLFSLQGNFIDTLCRGFQGLLEQYQPQVHKKLKDLSIQSQIYLIEWLFTFFSRGLTFQNTLKFWDHLLYFEEVTIFRMALCIFQQIGPSILQLTYEQTVNLVRDFGQQIDQNKLLEALTVCKLNSEKLNKAFEKASALKK